MDIYSIQARSFYRSYIRDEILEYEEDIVWLKDPNRLQWVRPFTASFSCPKGITELERQRWEWDENKDDEVAFLVVGFANLTDDAPASGFNDDGSPYWERRAFLLRLSDHPDHPKFHWGNNCPSEAVATITIKPRKQAISLKLLSQLGKNDKKF